MAPGRPARALSPRDALKDTHLEHQVDTSNDDVLYQSFECYGTRACSRNQDDELKCKVPHVSCWTHPIAIKFTYGSSLHGLQRQDHSVDHFLSHMAAAVRAQMTRYRTRGDDLAAIWDNSSIA